MVFEPLLIKSGSTIAMDGGSAENAGAIFCQISKKADLDSA
jgi:hypothetical protein